MALQTPLLVKLSPNAAPSAGVIATAPGVPSSGMGRILMLAALGIGGFLIYRHFKKKSDGGGE